MEERGGSSGGKPPVGRPRSGTIGSGGTGMGGRRAGGYHSEGYFSSDQDDEPSRRAGNCRSYKPAVNSFFFNFQIYKFFI